MLLRSIFGALSTILIGCYCCKSTYVFTCYIEESDSSQCRLSPAVPSCQAKWGLRHSFRVQRTWPELFQLVYFWCPKNVTLNPVLMCKTGRDLLTDYEMLVDQLCHIFYGHDKFKNKCTFEILLYGLFLFCRREKQIHYFNKGNTWTQMFASPGTCLWAIEPCVRTYNRPVWFGKHQVRPPWDSH